MDTAEKFENTTCGHKAKDITPSIAWRREALKEEALDDLPCKGHRQSDEQWDCNKGNVGKNFCETGWIAYGLFRAPRSHLN